MSSIPQIKMQDVEIMGKARWEMQTHVLTQWGRIRGSKLVSMHGSVVGTAEKWKEGNTSLK
jgi:hypothetical protein